MDLQPQPLSVLLTQRSDRQLARIIDGIERLLAAIRIEVLAEISLTVKQSNADDWSTQVAGRLHLVAGYVAKSARIDGQRFAQHELHAEVGDGRQRSVRMLMLEPCVGSIGFPIRPKQTVEFLAELRRT